MDLRGGHGRRFVQWLVRRSTVFEHLDLSTRRTKQAELRGGYLGFVQHERVELVKREPLSGRLHDDQAAVVAQPTTAAFAVKKSDQSLSLPRIAAPLDRTYRVTIGRATSRCISPVTSGSLVIGVVGHSLGS